MNREFWKKEPFSHSRLTCFDRCKYQFKLKYIDQIEATEPKPECFQRGIRIHEEIETGKETEEANNAYRLTEIARPTDRPTYSYFTSRKGYKGGLLQSKIYQKKSIYAIEQKELPFAFDKQFSIVDYDSPKSIFRGVIDYLKCETDTKETTELVGLQEMEGIKRIVIYDWKTGKTTGDRFQMEIYLLYASLCYPRVRDVSGHFVYVDQDRKSKEYRLSDSSLVIKKLQGKISQILATTEFEASPGFACGFCDYKKICEYTNPASGTTSESLQNLSLTSLASLTNLF